MWLVASGLWEAHKQQATCYQPVWHDLQAYVLHATSYKRRATILGDFYAAAVHVPAATQATLRTLWRGGGIKP